MITSRSNGNSFGLGGGGQTMMAGRGGLCGERRDTEGMTERLMAAVQSVS